MELSDSDDQPATPSSPSPPRNHYLSWREFLAVVILASVFAVPTFYSRGVRGIFLITSLLPIIGWLTITAHRFANWILTPPEHRQGLFAATWFWVSTASLLAYISLIELLYALERLDTQKEQKPDWPVTLPIATVFCFCMAVFRWCRTSVQGRENL